MTALMAHDVFISYSAHDKTTADAACATLEAHGVRCWIAPRDVLAGPNWAGAIIEAIPQRRALLLVFSADANSSQQVMREVERAVSMGIPIIPFRIEDIVPANAMEYYLGSHHWLDALTPPLQDHLQRLSETVTALLGAGAAAPRAPLPEPPAAPQPSAVSAPAPALQISRRNLLIGGGSGAAVVALLAAGLVLRAHDHGGEKPNAQVVPPRSATATATATAAATATAVAPLVGASLALAAPFPNVGVVADDEASRARVVESQQDLQLIFAQLNKDYGTGAAQPLAVHLTNDEGTARQVMGNLGLSFASVDGFFSNKAAAQKARGRQETGPLSTCRKPVETHSVERSHFPRQTICCGPSARSTATTSTLTGSSAAGRLTRSSASARAATAFAGRRCPMRKPGPLPRCRGSRHTPTCSSCIPIRRPGASTPAGR